jgi:thiol:disulfide interchange protein DsbA
MDCQRIDSILDEHQAAALGAAVRSEVEAHLQSCPRCSDAWLSHATLAADAPEPPRDGLFEQLAARAAARSRAAPTPYRRWLAPLGIAAAAAVLAVLVLRPGPGEPARPESGEAGPTVSASAPAPQSGLAQTESVSRPDRARFMAGRDYERLAQPAPTVSDPGLIEVCEFFMFGCPHCFAFEPALEAWDEAQPEHVSLVRVPAIFNATARLHAQAYYTAEVLGQAEALRGPFYEEIHVRGNALASVAAIRELFGRHGIDAASFDEAFESVGVQARLQRAEEMNRRYRISVTPSMGVNGKYLTNAAMVGSNEAMLEVVDALVESELGEPCRDSDGTRCPLFE